MNIIYKGKIIRYELLICVLFMRIMLMWMICLCIEENKYDINCDRLSLCICLWILMLLVKLKCRWYRVLI